MTPFLTSAPVRATLRWQAAATMFVALVAGAWVGLEGAVSALLGGSITVIAGVAFAAVVSMRRVASAESTVVTMFAAEGVKIGAIIVLLWVVITQYQALVAAAFFAAFVVTVLLNRIAFMVPSPDATELDKLEAK